VRATRRSTASAEEIRSCCVAEQVDRRADITRRQIIRAAAGHFARQPYDLVSLDDILADAAVTKGAMYFHFRSKHALASAIVERWVHKTLAAVSDVVSRQHSAMETVVDITYVIAHNDLTDPMARAGFNLLESIGRSDELQLRTVAIWVATFTELIRRAQDEGDATEGQDADHIARLLVGFYLGVRHTTDLDDPARYLNDLGCAWDLVLPGLVVPDRLGYLSTFVRRRTTLALTRAAQPNTGTP
jgi:AcrR family transcriptional regulator